MNGYVFKFSGDNYVTIWARSKHLAREMLPSVLLDNNYQALVKELNGGRDIKCVRIIPRKKV